MFKPLLLLSALLLLGSCDGWFTRRSDPRSVDPYGPYYRDDSDRRMSKKPKKPVVFDDRYDDNFMMVATPSPEWLTLDYACAGSLRKAQWLVCENEYLGQLHRRLAMQWEDQRRNGSPERLSVIGAQQSAFLRERNACEDKDCVADAYRRYLDDEGPVAPWHPPVKREVVKYVVKPGWKPAWKHEYRSDWRARHGYHDGKPRGDFGYGDPKPRSCVADIGFASAQRLSERCDDVTPGLSSLCSVHNSCSGIKAQIDRGCSRSNDRPGYCRQY